MPKGIDVKVACSVAVSAKNKVRNRYTDILPCKSDFVTWPSLHDIDDDTRVKLEAENDYINANFIRKTFQAAEFTYIASQVCSYYFGCNPT